MAFDRKHILRIVDSIRYPIKGNYAEASITYVRRHCLKKVGREKEYAAAITHMALKSLV